MIRYFTLSLPPVVERELRVASRKPATYWGRTAAGAAGVAAIFFVLIAQIASSSLAVLGQITFRVLGCMATFIVFTSVLQSSTEAFAREKREDTLGLLFLTPLRPAEIALGKLASTSLSAFYQFLALVPMLAVPILAGGVSATDFSLLLIGLINFVFIAATLGLWVSALCWDEKRAASLASSILIALFLLPGVMAIGTANVFGRPTAEVVGLFSPGFTIMQALVQRSASAISILGSILWTQLLGWSFFYFTCHTLPRCWQKRPESLAPKADHLQSAKTQSSSSARNAARETRPERKLTRRQFSAEERTALLERNPISWFAMRWKPSASGPWAIGVIAVMGYVPAVFAGINANEWGLIRAPGYALIVLFFVNMAIKIFAAHHASFSFARDRGDDTLELLLSTPNTARAVIDGHTHALGELLRPVVRRALWLEGAWLVTTIATHKGGWGEMLFYVLASFATLAMLVPDVRALAWTAMWQSVIKKDARAAEQEAFSKVAFLPWLSVLVPGAIGGLFGVTGFLFTLVISWTVAGAIADSYFSSQAQQRLQTRLALWAARRAANEFEHYDGWKDLGRRVGRWWALRGQPPSPLFATDPGPRKSPAISTSRSD